jgi:hypothetical protein
MSKDTLKISYNICKASKANMGNEIKVSWQLTSIRIWYVTQWHEPKKCRRFPLTAHIFIAVIHICPTPVHRAILNNYYPNILHCTIRKQGTMTTTLAAHPSWERRNICNLIAVIGEGACVGCYSEVWIQVTRNQNLILVHWHSKHSVILTNVQSIYS